MRPMLIIALICMACTQGGDEQMEADSASAANSIKLQFARAKAAERAAAAADSARQDSIGRAQQFKEYSEAFVQLRKFTADSIPLIPAKVRGALNDRGCIIPQPYPDQILNAVKGAFTANGADEWAVMCATPVSSQILFLDA